MSITANHSSGPYKSLTAKIAIVVPELAEGGGVPGVAAFLHQVISKSGRYVSDVISIPVSSRDSASVRLRSIGSWLRGPQVFTGEWQGIPFKHVGSYCAEIEFVRYLPRAPLTRLLQQYDLIQVVAGTPMFALAVSSVSQPKVITVGTTLLQDRRSALSVAKGWSKFWKSGMTQVDVLMERLALPKMEHVFAQSEYTHRLLQPIVPKGKLSLACPGVDTEMFHPATNPGRGYILAVGRFSDPRKNVQLLFKAYHRVRQQLPNAPPLVLAGSVGPTPGDMEVARELRIEEQIQFRQGPSTEELAALYREAAVFVLSSDEEGFGMVLLEAMASGLPIVCTRCGGPETAIVDGSSGYLTPVGDANALASRVCEVLSGEPLRRQMGEAGRRRVEEYFSLEAAGRPYLDKYAELLN